MRQAITREPELELLAGRALAKLSPSRTHGVIQLAVGNLLLARSRGRGCVATEWRFALNADGDPRTSLIPDVAFVSNERLALLGAEAREEPPFAPDIAVEVRSPDDRIADVEWKMNAYLAYGGVLALDVVPIDRIVRAYSHAGLAVFARGERFACAEVPWLTFQVAEVFANL